MSDTQKTPFVERLPCKLSPAEITLKAAELANTVSKRDALTLEKTLATQRYAKAVKDAERRLGDLAEEVRTGVEYRHVKVTERRDFHRNTVEIVRLDTHEVCGQRAMRGEERQAELGLPRGGNGETQLELGDGPGDEEQDDEEDDDTDDAGSAAEAH